jgi:uncharacterized membrane protein YczE
MEKVKRYVIFLVGLFISSLGVSFVTKANLGTSPISSIPYVLSLNFKLSLGEFTIIFSLLLIALQLIILKKDFKFEHILQIPISVAFGYFIDLTMSMLSAIKPSSYLYSIVFLIIGCVILSLGVYIEVLANVAMLPGESFVRAITMKFNTDFGITKIAFDVVMTVVAGVLSLVFAHKIQGVREGTLVAALLVGFVAKIFGQLLSFVPKFLFPQQKELETE